MNYKDYVIPKLRDLNKKRFAVTNLQEQISALKIEFSALRAARTDGDPVSGGTNRREEMMLNNICERDYLRSCLQVTRMEIHTVEAALEKMDENERFVLDRFYIDRRADYVGEISERLHVERSRVYQIKDRALVNFTKLFCGIATL